MFAEFFLSNKYLSMYVCGGFFVFVSQCVTKFSAEYLLSVYMEK